MDWVGVQTSLITVKHSVGIIFEVVVPHDTPPHVEEVIHHSTCQGLRSGDSQDFRLSSCEDSSVSCLKPFDSDNKYKKFMVTLSLSHYQGHCP